MQYAQNGAQRQDGTRALDGSKQRDLYSCIGEPSVGERGTADSHKDDYEPENGNKPIDALPKSEHLTLQVTKACINDVQSDDLGGSRGEPAACCRAWNASSRRVSNDSGRSDQIAEAMIVPAKSSSRGSHDSINRAAANVATRNTIYMPRPLMK